MRAFLNKKNCKPGDVLLTCAPICAVSLNNSLCGSCLKSLKSLKRCSSCKEVSYCSVGCQKLDWSSHKVECIAPTKLGSNITPSLRLMLRCALLIGGSDLHKAKFNELCSNWQTLSDDHKNRHAELIPIFKATLGPERFSDIFLTLRSFLEFVNRVVVNTVVILSEELVAIGYGIYLDASVVNHSCSPNAVFNFTDAQLQLRSLKCLESGEEIFVSYSDQLVPKQERREVLKEQFNFMCNCSECSSGVREKLFTAMKCQSSDCQSIVSSNDLLCNSCGRETELVTEQLFSFKSLDLSNKLDISKEIEQLEKLCPDHNLVLHGLLVKQAIVLSSQCRFEDALDFERRIARNYESFFSEFHPLKSLQYVRVAKILSSIGSLTESVKCFELALKNLKVTHGCESLLYLTLMEQYRFDKLDLSNKPWSGSPRDEMKTLQTA